VDIPPVPSLRSDSQPILDLRRASSISSQSSQTPPKQQASRSVSGLSPLKEQTILNYSRPMSPASVASPRNTPLYNQSLLNDPNITNSTNSKAFDGANPPTPTNSAAKATKKSRAQRSLSLDEGSTTRVDKSSSSTQSRPVSQLYRQPSTVMEETDGDDSTLSSNMTANKARKFSTGKMRPLSVQDVQPARSPSDNSAAPRSSSISQMPRRVSNASSLDVPDAASKSTRFSTNLTGSATTRKDPLPRSMSPAKSAMKQSPSLSNGSSFGSPPTESAPIFTNQGSGYTSDTGSTNSKRKRSVRVSFDENSMSKLNGIQVGLQKVVIEKNSDELVKPRPALPVFGSVRSTSPNPPSEQAETALVVKPGKRSSAAKGVQAGKVTSILTPSPKQPSGNESIPPEVTSVEGSGQTTDTELSDDEIDTGMSTSVLGSTGQTSVMESSAASLKPIYPSKPSTAQSSNLAPEDVPDILVLPATPAVEMPPELTISGRSNNKGLGMPGSWDDLHDVYQREDGSQPGKKGVETQAVKIKQSQDDESDPADSEDSAAFSDAAEDPSELEPYGYASLNAVVESPHVLPQSNDVSSTRADQVDNESPVKAVTAARRTRREQRSRKESEETTLKLPRDADSKTKTTGGNSLLRQNVGNDSSSSQPKLKSAMKNGQSKTNPTSESPAFRRTMRGSVDASKLRTAQSPTNRTAQSPTNRQGSSVMQTKTLRPQSMQGSSRYTLRQQAPPHPAVNNDSDSESSFKRQKRPQNESYVMKGSMRSSSVDFHSVQRASSPPAVKGSSRWSIRSLSPMGRSRKQDPSTIRQSLRGGPVDNMPTLRNKAAKGGNVKHNAPNKFASRFQDSDSDSDGLNTNTRLNTLNNGYTASKVTPSRQQFGRQQLVAQNNSANLDSSSDDDFTRRRAAKRKGPKAVIKPVVVTPQADLDVIMAAARRNVAAMTGNQTIITSPTATSTQSKPALSTDQQSIMSNTTVTRNLPQINTSIPNTPTNRKRGFFNTLLRGREQPASPAISESDKSLPRSPKTSNGKLQRRQRPGQLGRTASTTSTATVDSIGFGGTTSVMAEQIAHMPAVQEQSEHVIHDTPVQNSIKKPDETKSSFEQPITLNNIVKEPGTPQTSASVSGSRGPEWPLGPSTADNAAVSELPPPPPIPYSVVDSGLSRSASSDGLSATRRAQILSQAGFTFPNAKDDNEMTRPGNRRSMSGRLVQSVKGFGRKNNVNGHGHSSSVTVPGPLGRSVVGAGEVLDDSSSDDSGINGLSFMHDEGVDGNEREGEDNGDDAQTRKKKKFTSRLKRMFGIHAATA